MSDKPANSNIDLRRPRPNVIDQRQQQIDPAGHNRVDDNRRPDSNSKQPGRTDKSTNGHESDDRKLEE